MSHLLAGRQASRLLVTAASLVAALVLAEGASAAPCPGAGSCPWTQVDTFGDVGSGEFRAPLGIGVDAGGNLYVAEEDTNRVQKLDPSGGFLAKWGLEKTAGGELSSPEGIAVDAGAGGVYVTDNHSRIEKFDTSGNFVSAWGWGVTDGSAAYQICTSGCRAGIAGSGSGQFGSPLGIATDGANVYVADFNNKRIQKFDLGGARVAEWAIPGGQHPERVAVAAGKVYVTTRSATVWRFDTSGTPDNSWDGDGVTGSSGSGAGQLDWPEGITADATGVYVADSKNQRVTKFDLNGGFAATWGTQGQGDGQFNFPYGILATGGSVWVADTYNHRLEKFTPAGAHQLNVGTPPGAGEFYYPADVSAIPSGDVYVADWSGHDIQRLGASGNPLVRWSIPGAPASITPTANGAYVPETPNHVSLYDDAGSLLDQFGGAGSGLGQFNFPGGSAADADGNLYVADVANHRVQKVDPAGAPLAVFGSQGSGDGKLNNPRDVALDAAGNVYVADSGNNRIEKFAGDGTFLAKWGSAGGGDGQFINPSGVALDSRGHVFVSDTGNNRIEELGADGTFIAKWGTLGGGQGELNEPAGLTVDSSGAIWVADQSNHRIVRFCCPAADGGPGPGGGTEPPPPGGAADTTSPRIKLSGRTVQRSRRVARGGLALRIATDEGARVTLKAALPRALARRLGVRGASIGGTTVDLAAQGTQGLRLRLTARARRALLRAPRARIVVRASAADRAGNRSSASLTIAVRR
jgi:tripartite motif-containing protein 71